MKKKTEQERSSQTVSVEIPTDPEEIARLEARNGLRQFDAVVRIIDQSIGQREPFKLRPSIALELNRLAIDGVNPQAGAYRTTEIRIYGSKHQPPPAKDVPVLMEAMCEYANEKWESPPIHLAAYLMWRINWVHPFADGNGRSARALSYAILCIRLGFRLPGTKTIPEQIVENKFPYYDALEAADKSWEKGEIDVSAMEQLLSSALASQLMSVHRLATGETN